MHATQGGAIQSTTRPPAHDRAPRAQGATWHRRTQAMGAARCDHPLAHRAHNETTPTEQPNKVERTTKRGRITITPRSARPTRPRSVSTMPTRTSKLNLCGGEPPSPGQGQLQHLLALESRSAEPATSQPTNAGFTTYAQTPLPSGQVDAWPRAHGGMVANARGARANSGGGC